MRRREFITLLDAAAAGTSGHSAREPIAKIIARKFPKSKLRLSSAA
jgi:hypothetical protein